MPAVFVFTALPCEAKPLIQAWQLKKHAQSQPFALYSNEDRVLVVCGIGKLAMAGALGHTLGLLGNDPHPILINLGIAGHQTHARGSAFLIDKIIDADSERRFYPQLLPQLSCPSYPVKTWAKPQSHYAADYLYDMEASGFYEMAVKFSSAELIHGLKIISDNAKDPIEHINEQRVIDWITPQLPLLDNLLAQLMRRRQSLLTVECALYPRLLSEFHFTASNAAKLKALLLNWKLLSNNLPLNWTDANAGNGKQLITWLEHQLEQYAFHL